MQTKTQKEFDSLLREAVLRQLEWEPQISSRDIHVSAAGNVITLTGFVPTFAEKCAAEKAAQVVHGVQAVANEIEVTPVTSHTDPEVAHDIIHAMKINITIPDQGITVLVNEGFVTLQGSVEWDFQRRDAESCARSIAGVRSVINHISVLTRVSGAGA